MKALLARLLNRWVVSVAGLIVVALLIWLFGDAVAIGGRVPLASEIARLVAILVVVLVWAGINIVVALRQKRANAAVVDGLMAQPEPPPEAPGAAASREEVETLAARFRDALATLKEAKLGGGGGRRYLYQLPWYVIIGPPGSGKTTALANSGLRFPLEDRFGKNAVRGVGGTRNCDWFFTDDAVLLDTAGRYTTQDADEAVDRSAWQGFLSLLRTHRPQRPLEGIIVAFSISDLGGRDPAERLSHARAVKRRIQELYAELKLRAPIYVVFTKCDLVAGFTEFFADLTGEERAQVWGTTFSLAESANPNSIVEAFPGEFDRLLDRLTARLIPRLEQERDLGRRGLLLSFPQQMNLLKPALHAFLQEMLTHTRFEEPLLVRGIYLTSATQQGSPIDRVIGAVAAGFRLERQAMPAFSGRGVSYFLNRLLKAVIFPEAGLVTSTGFLGRYRPYLQWGAYGGIALATVLAVLLLFGSFTGNRALIADVDTQVTRFKETRAEALAGRGGAEELLAALDALHDLPGGYGARDTGAPLMLTFGLYQGDKLGEAAQDAYARALNALFVPVLMTRLEQQIVANLQNPELINQALRVYLMMATPERRDPDFMTLWMTTDWNTRFAAPAQAPLRASFDRHLGALFAVGIEPTPQASDAVVARAREALAKVPLGSRIYAQLKAQQQAAAGRDWALADHVAPAQLRYFRRKSGQPMTAGVPRLYTVAGYRELFIDRRARLVDDALKETWVLGPMLAPAESETGRADLERRVEELYLNDYIARWRSLIDDLQLLPAPNVEVQADVVRAIAQPDGPIKALLVAVSAQTQLSRALRAAQPEAAEAKPGGLQQLRERVEGLIGAGKPATASAAAYDPTVRVDQTFEPLAALVRGDAGMPAPIDGVLQPFAQLYDYLLQVQQGGTEGKGAVPRFSADYPRGTAIIAQLSGVARAQPEPLRAWLLTLLGETKAKAVDPKRGEAAKRVNDVWRSTVAPACRQALANRYPFVRGAPNDVNIGDFARILGPNGAIDTFAKEYVEPHADTSVQPWRWIEASAGGLSFAPASIRMFETAARIRQAFFPGGQGQPQVSFEIEPLSLDSRARQVQLQVGEQTLSYEHGPRKPVRMQWPAPSGSGARITVTPVDAAGQTIGASFPGPWGLFHLLDKAAVEGSAGMDRFRVGVDVQGYQAAFLIRADSVINPFALPELTRFQCLDSL